MLKALEARAQKAAAAAAAETQSELPTGRNGVPVDDDPADEDPEESWLAARSAAVPNIRWVQEEPVVKLRRRFPVHVNIATDEAGTRFDTWMLDYPGGALMTNEDASDPLTRALYDLVNRRCPVVYRYQGHHVAHLWLSWPDEENFPAPSRGTRSWYRRWDECRLEWQPLPGTLECPAWHRPDLIQEWLYLLLADNVCFTGLETEGRKLMYQAWLAAGTAGPDGWVKDGELATRCREKLGYEEEQYAELRTLCSGYGYVAWKASRPDSFVRLTKHGMNSIS